MIEEGLRKPPGFHRDIHCPVGPVYGFPVETADLARFVTAPSGVQMLHCVKLNFFPDEDVPTKWEFGVDCRYEFMVGPDLQGPKIRFLSPPLAP